MFVAACDSMPVAKIVCHVNVEFQRQRKCVWMKEILLEGGNISRLDELFNEEVVDNLIYQKYESRSTWMGKWVLKIVGCINSKS
ncbi:unnamed protein product [Trifolium pratense]|uniref:Uncharacterized protein n=1 Tax=Trifolium pratense TaxID=57577 RepID=A0ACB0IZE2_TRIPR|nr:unnamed protein product [Trifolium pratense]